MSLTNQGIAKSYTKDKLEVGLLDQINVERLLTMYQGDLSKVQVEVIFPDPRRVTKKQRALYYALLGDIYAWSGHSVEFLDELFRAKYTIETLGDVISLSDATESTVSDANKLLDIVIDFMFKWRVPFKYGYELLPKEENWYLYRCCKYRVCCICGKHADIHHVDVLGAGLNRNKVDHTKRHVLPLCRNHHGQIEQYGNEKFGELYKIPTTGIKLDEQTLKEIGVKGDYGK
ncbi:hypothetical protein LB941_00925 [Ligilactobacillus sp. WILCCON 0076]|uniref:DUF968 domain-containing protein n=1 Tax=Ligilactobacillus ubinensis TaxID=2876789 RepID=A0A9X2FGJ9_9LACO|nr:putative HNHc nuclease [Ligilactobacillus ubinensis]MCP0885896.1 hypothetical protein [Ligilactobacillus ubinensis]